MVFLKLYGLQNEFARRLNSQRRWLTTVVPMEPLSFARIRANVNPATDRLSRDCGEYVHRLSCRRYSRSGA